MNQICIGQHGTLAELLRNWLRDELCLPLAFDKIASMEVAYGCNAESGGVLSRVTGVTLHPGRNRCGSRDPAPASDHSRRKPESMDTTRNVTCVHHGCCGIGLVCTHVAHAIDRGELVGFCWGAQTDLAQPDAWCDECNEKRKNPGTKTEEEWFREAEFKVLCEHCWDEAKHVCGGFRH